MGCDFEFFNITRNEASKKIENYKLRRNINRGSKGYMIQIVLDVVELNNWSKEDKISIKCCCCGDYTFYEGALTLFDRELDDDLMSV